MFDGTVAAALEGRSVNAALLVEMRFEGETRRWWQGFGPLESGGKTWQGLGHLISVDGLQSAVGTVAPSTTFTLSGVDPEIVALAREGSARVKGRKALVYIQFFEVDPSDGRKSWGTLDDPSVIWSGRMDQLRFVADGPSARTITLTAESIWADRNRPPFGLYTYEDQQARFPGDKGLSQVADLVTKQIRWPEFVLAIGICGLALRSSGLT